MGSADFFKAGEWNAYCNLCGKKAKSGTMEQTWDKRWVCRSHKEVRNPQDFVRGVKDSPAIPWSTGGQPMPAASAIGGRLLLEPNIGTGLLTESGGYIIL